jgi:hypothetical protein
VIHEREIITEQFIGLANKAIQRSGQFPGGAFRRLDAGSALCAACFRRLSRVHLFWGDERCVPPDHPESNFRMVQESLLSKIQIPPENVHRMAGEKDPEQAAREYKEYLRQFIYRTPACHGSISFFSAWAKMDTPHRFSPAVQRWTSRIAWSQRCRSRD